MHQKTPLLQWPRIFVIYGTEKAPAPPSRVWPDDRRQRAFLWPCAERMPKRQNPGRLGRGQSSASTRRLEPIEDLVGPEALQAMERLVQRREFVGVDAADLLNGADVFLIKRIDDVTHILALDGQLDAHRAAVDPRSLMIEEAHLHELLQI